MLWRWLPEVIWSRRDSWIHEFIYSARCEEHSSAACAAHHYSDEVSELGISTSALRCDTVPWHLCQNVRHHANASDASECKASADETSADEKPRIHKCSKRRECSNHHSRRDHRLPDDGYVALGMCRDWKPRGLPRLKTAIDDSDIAPTRRAQHLSNVCGSFA